MQLLDESHTIWLYLIHHKHSLRNCSREEGGWGVVLKEIEGSPNEGNKALFASIFI